MLGAGERRAVKGRARARRRAPLRLRCRWRPGRRAARTGVHRAGRSRGPGTGAAREKSGRYASLNGGTVAARTRAPRLAGERGARSWSFQNTRRARARGRIASVARRNRRMVARVAHMGARRERRGEKHELIRCLGASERVELRFGGLVRVRAGRDLPLSRHVRGGVRIIGKPARTRPGSAPDKRIRCAAPLPIRSDRRHLQRGRAGGSFANCAWRPRARVCAEQPEQYGQRDQSTNAEGHLDLPHRGAASTRDPFIRPENTLCRQRSRQFADADQPAQRTRGTPIPVEDPYNLYFTPDGHYAIVVAERLQRLDFRDPRTMRLIKSVSVPSCRGVDHMDFSADGRYAFASCEFSGRMIEIDLERSSGDPNARVGDGLTSPQDVKLSPDGRTIYVADQGTRWCLGDRPADTFAVTGFVKTGGGAHGLYPSWMHASYMSPTASPERSLLSASGRAAWWQPGSFPCPRALTWEGSPRTGRTLWLSGRYNAEVYAINTATGRGPRARIPVGQGPHGLCVWPQPGAHSLGHTGIMR